MCRRAISPVQSRRTALIWTQLTMSVPPASGSPAPSRRIGDTGVPARRSLARSSAGATLAPEAGRQASCDPLCCRRIHVGQHDHEVAGLRVDPQIPVHACRAPRRGPPGRSPPRPGYFGTRTRTGRQAPSPPFRCPAAAWSRGEAAGGPAAPGRTVPGPQPLSNRRRRRFRARAACRWSGPTWPFPAASCIRPTDPGPLRVRAATRSWSCSRAGGCARARSRSRSGRRPSRSRRRAG
jgi:hypothetical protein